MPFIECLARGAKSVCAGPHLPHNNCGGRNNYYYPILLVSKHSEGVKWLVQDHSAGSQNLPASPALSEHMAAALCVVRTAEKSAAGGDGAAWCGLHTAGDI